MGMLEGKTVAVTGGGAGIGRAVCLASAAAGANVVVCDYGVAMDGSDPSSEVADAVVAEITAAGGNAVALAGDVSKFATGEQVVAAAVDTWGSIDGVACVAGNLRERMLFNMSEDEFDSVIAVHLKGHFNIYRHASAVMRKQPNGGSIIGFTSGAHIGSTAQANYSAAKGGIVSLARSVAAGMYKYGVRSNVIAPVAKSRMSGNVPFGIEMGEPEDVAPMVGFLLSDRSTDVTGQIYTANGGKIAVWNQPVEVREMRTDGRWTIDGIADRFSEVGQEELGLIKVLAEREAAAKAAKESGSTPNQ